MSTGWLVVCLIAGACVACIWAYFWGRGNGYHDGCAAGTATGRRAERQAIEAIMTKMVNRSRAAEQAVDYLYERARWQVEHVDPRPSPPDEDSRS
jgi:hypothetical protein